MQSVELEHPVAHLNKSDEADDCELQSHSTEIAMSRITHHMHGSENDVLKELGRKFARRIAVLVIDMQNDFIDGTLPIGAGDANDNPHNIFENINGIVDKAAGLVVFTQDWHPTNHISFLSAARDQDRELAQKHRTANLALFDEVQFDTPTCSQVLYPLHCLKETYGAALHPRIRVPKNAHFVRKGENPHVEEYSAFGCQKNGIKSNLESLLREHNVSAVLCLGIAYDICVAETALSASRLGFSVAVVRDASAAFTKSGIAKMETAFTNHGISVISADVAKLIVAGETLPQQWIQKTLLT